MQLVRTVVAVGGALTLVIDETWERRWGHRLNQRGHARDPLALSQQRSGATSGVRWRVWTLVITPPWPQRAWAWPVLSVPAPPSQVSRRLGLRHPTVPRRARPMLLAVHRGLPGVTVTRLGDQPESVHAWGVACARRDVRVVAPVWMDAAWYEPAPPRQPGTHGHGSKAHVCHRCSGRSRRRKLPGRACVCAGRTAAAVSCT